MSSPRLVEAGTRLGREHGQQHARFALHWLQHVERTRAKILQGAQLAASTDCVTVLGAGSAYNIPLAELAEMFATVRVVDIDRDGLQAAIDGLPSEARARVEVHVADLTGGAAGALLDAGADAIAGSATVDTALARLTELFRSAAAIAAQPDSEQRNAWRAGYVISSCVASQLALFPHRAIVEAFARKFGAAGSARVFREAGVDQVREQWVRRHGEFLAALVAPGGAVYWSDTVAETPVLTQLGAAPLAAMVDSVATFLQKQKSAELRAFLTDAGKADLATRFAQVGALRLAASTAGRREQGERLLQAFKAQLDTQQRRIVSWALITAVGEDLMAAQPELKLLDFIRRTAEQLHPQARQPLLQTRFIHLFPAALAAEGKLESWLWINDPSAAATLEGGAFYVEAQLLRRATDGS